MAVDRLADALNTIKTHVFVGQKKCEVPATKLVRSVLEVLKNHNYVEDFKFIDDGRGGYFEVELTEKINDCGVIKPRMPVKNSEWNEAEERFIPAYNIGILVVTTSQGVMTNRDAREKKIGGRLLAYVY